MIELQRGRGYLTTEGRDLLAYCQGGAELRFSRAAIGDGEIKNSEQLLNMKSLVNEILQVNLKGIKANGDGTSTITLSIDNENVKKGFMMREVGLFAEDPRKGEILYAVISYGEFPDFIAPETQELTEILIDIYVVVANVENISLNIDRSNVWVTQQELIDLAGVGRTNQTVKGNWDLIQNLSLQILMLMTRPGGGTGGTGGTGGSNEPLDIHQFKVSFPLTEDEEWYGIYDSENLRLVI